MTSKLPLIAPYSIIPLARFFFPKQCWGNRHASDSIAVPNCMFLHPSVELWWCELIYKRCRQRCFPPDYWSSVLPAWRNSKGGLKVIGSRYQSCSPGSLTCSQVKISSKYEIWKRHRKQQKIFFSVFSFLHGPIHLLDDRTTIARLLLLMWLLCWHKASQIEIEAEAHHQKKSLVFDAPGVRGCDEAPQVINLCLMLVVVWCSLALISCCCCCS